MTSSWDHRPAGDAGETFWSPNYFLSWNTGESFPVSHGFHYRPAPLGDWSLESINSSRRSEQQHRYRPIVSPRSHLSKYWTHFPQLKKEKINFVHGLVCRDLGTHRVPCGAPLCSLPWCQPGEETLEGISMPRPLPRLEVFLTIGNALELHHVWYWVSSAIRARHRTFYSKNRPSSNRSHACTDLQEATEKKEIEEDGWKNGSGRCLRPGVAEARSRQIQTLRVSVIERFTHNAWSIIRL